MEVKTLWAGQWKDGSLVIGVADDNTTLMYDFQGYNFHMSNQIPLDLSSAPGVDMELHSHLFVAKVLELANKQWIKVSIMHWEAYKESYAEGLADHVIPIH